ncbi:hypothetical protein ID866_10860, partial [Astraeus odoratus]
MISIISPWMTSGTAHAYVQDPSIDPRPLLVGIASALEYIHSLTPIICHGDVKGYNILISDDGRALLADFGHSRIVDPSLSSMAYEHPTGGTLRWMSPELLTYTHCGPTPASDVWSF